MGKELLETLLFSSDTGGRGVAVEDAGRGGGGGVSSSVYVSTILGHVLGYQRSTHVLVGRYES